MIPFIFLQITKENSFLAYVNLSIIKNTLPLFEQISIE